MLFSSSSFKVECLDAVSFPYGEETYVPQPIALSAVLVRNWSPLFLNKMLNVVSPPQRVNFFRLKPKI
jgi:hypothetical protein